ncbi:MAG TPA: hypothetical protein VIR01_03075, partial [Pyrinomonadaceae bacterium]
WSSEESAELAVGVTYVRWIEVPVDVKKSGAAVPFAASCISEFAKTRQIVRCKQGQTVVEA